MVIKCKQSGETFETSKEEIDFRKSTSPFPATPSLAIPAPLHCPSVRRQRRLAFRNDRNLYMRPCEATNKRVISTYSPDKAQTVYHQDQWWGDRWNALDFGRTFDRSQSFFDQFHDLRSAVPAKALTNTNCENCDFNNNLTNCKNCYLSFGCMESEDTYYSTDSYKLRDCTDVWWSREIELGVGIYNSKGLYDCLFCQDCTDSHNLIFCSSCYNCSDCFGCFNLNRKKYCIFNVEYSKEEYADHLETFRRGSYRQVKNLIEEVRAFYLSQPHRATKTRFAENCSGDMIYRSKNCHGCFTVADSEDCMHLFECARNKNCHDMDYSYDCTGLVLEALASTSCFHSAFLVDSHRCTDSYYLAECYSLKNCFGCVGLRNQEYCILNKKYSQEEYQQLVPKIIECMAENSEWGEFFPVSVSPYGYNETDAALFYPLSEEEASALSANWSHYEKPEPVAPRIIMAGDLPDSIREVEDDILECAIGCEVSGKLFRLTKAELEFCRKHVLPLPRKHPDQRHKEMLALRNPMKLWPRTCAKCEKEIQTTYGPERKEIIHCEECYIEEVR